MLQYLDGQPGKVCSHTILRIYWPENNCFSFTKRNRNEHHWELPYVICLTVFFHNRSSYKVSLLQRRQSPCINIGLLNYSVPKLIHATRDQYNYSVRCRMNIAQLGAQSLQSTIV